MKHLQNLYDRLLESQPPSLLQRLNPFSGKQKQPATGLYFWGGVGRGKTYLMGYLLRLSAIPGKDAPALSPFYATGAF